MSLKKKFTGQVRITVKYITLIFTQITLANVQIYLFFSHIGVKLLCRLSSLAVFGKQSGRKTTLNFKPNHLKLDKMVQYYVCKIKR